MSLVGQLLCSDSSTLRVTSRLCHWNFASNNGKFPPGCGNSLIVGKQLKPYTSPSQSPSTACRGGGGAVLGTVGFLAASPASTHEMPGAVTLCTSDVHQKCLQTLAPVRWRQHISILQKVPFVPSQTPVKHCSDLCPPQFCLVLAFT